MSAGRPAGQRRVGGELLRLRPGVIADAQIQLAVRPLQNRVRPVLAHAAAELVDQRDLVDLVGVFGVAASV